MKLISIITVVLVSSLTYVFNDGNKNNSTTKKYTLNSKWPQLPQTFVLGQVTGVGVDTNDHVFLFHRAERVWTTPFPTTTISSPTILELHEKTGKIIKSWGENYFIMPHGLTVDDKNNVWVTDVALHQVFKFTHDGTLLFKVGISAQAGSDSTHFNMPTDIAVCKNGCFYVSDGYGNSRIIKFSANGKYLFEWGKKGTGSGEFDIPHSIDLDSDENVYVADRENNRIQKFSETGKFIAEWKNTQATGLYALTVRKNSNEVFAVDYHMASDIIKGSDILFFTLPFTLVNRLGRSGNYKGHVCRYHDIATDKRGNVYVGDILGNCIQKFSKK